MTTEVKLKKISVIKPGSNPDVDSDFNTEIRDPVLEAVTQEYGIDNVANIITHNTLAAKGAFSKMCTIYQVPFAKAKKISALVPPPIEGVQCTIEDIFNPESDRYSEGEDFRNATEGEEWKLIIEGAKALEGRNNSTGVHPCFVAGAKVKVSEGYKNIEDVKIGDSVLTHSNVYQKVVDVMTNESSDIYELRVANSAPLEATGNHPFYVREIVQKSGRKNVGEITRELTSPEWKELSELTPKKTLIGVAVNNKSELPNLDYSLPFENENFWRNIGEIIGSEDSNDSGNYSKDLSEFLKLFGKGAKNKIVPDFVLNLPVKLLEAFLEGYLSADGSVLKSNNLHSFSTVSKELFLGMIAVVNKVYRVACSVSYEKRDVMVIEGREVNCNDRYIAKFFKKEKLKGHSFYEDGYIWSSITSIKKVEKTEKTYNLSVLNDNSYTVNNLIAHNCGVIISAKPLQNFIPLQVRQEDGRVITQFTYTECESLGLIKMDFLGLDTVDLIQYTVEYIRKNGKTPPNMVEIIHGDMNDKKTFDMLQRGDTIGVFQLASEGVQDLLKRMKPTEFDDIVATTALFRPGPMGMQSHIKYADRKNNREENEPIHPEFKGSALDQILAKTYNLVVYQEQIIQIANRIAGMTLQEGDDLRKAMGKKKIDVMAKMKPKFMEGGNKNGFSDEALNILWDTIALFAKYGFNKSHSVAYAMNAYQAAYLKANYPVEFMAALISQNVGKKDKILAFLQEARKMGLTVGTVDINASDVKVSPDYDNKTLFDIVYGISGVDGVSKDMASIIVKERERKGPYKSVKDLIDRCYPKGVTNRKIYENLALAGAFDSFEKTTRKGVVENLTKLLGGAKTSTVRGADIFSVMLGSSAQEISIDLMRDGEYSHVEKLKREADVIGLYLTGHPLSYAGPGLSKLANATIASLTKAKKFGEYKIAGAVTEIARKQRRNGGKSVAITIDDNTGYITGHLSQDIIKGIDKYNAQMKIKEAYVKGLNEANHNNAAIALDKKIRPHEDLVLNNVYVFTITYRPGHGDNPDSMRVTKIQPLTLTHDGLLPVRIRFHATEKDLEQKKKLYKALPANLGRKKPGEYPIFVSIFKNLEKALEKENEDQYADAYYYLIEFEKNNVGNKETTEVAGDESLTGEKVTRIKKGKNAAKVVEQTREWPPPPVKNNPHKVDIQYKETLLERQARAIELLDYKDSGYLTTKTPEVEAIIEKFVGVENYDFGVFDPDVLLEDIFKE